MFPPDLTRVDLADGTEPPIAADSTTFRGVVFTTQIPDRADGSLELGGIQAQTRQTLANLAASLERANSDLSRLLHLTVYLTSIDDWTAFNEIYAEMVPRPHPVRCCVAVAALAVEGMRIEVTAIAAELLGHQLVRGGSAERAPRGHGRQS